MAEFPGPSIYNQDGLTFLRTLFPPASEGFIETRCLCDGEVQRQDFNPSDHELHVLGVNSPSGTWDMFVGVAPRSRKEGTKAAVRGVWAAWVDLDVPDAADRLAHFELEPSLVVSSGTPGHLHAYWPLTEPAEPEAIERVNRALARRLGADPAAVDASRLMRLPGTPNCKMDPPATAKLLHADDRRFDLAAIESILDPTEAEEDEAAEELDAPSEPVRHVLELLPDAKPSGTGWQASCPAHDDKHPSLSVAEGGDGRCLVHCFAGCKTEDVVAALGLEMSDLSLAPAKGRRASSRLIHLAEHAGIEPFRTPEGTAHATVKVDQHHETWQLRSNGFALWLRKLHYEAVEEALPEDALGETIATFEAKALFAAEEREVHRRVAKEGDRVLVDVGDKDWRTIEISAEGWGPPENPDVRFVRDASARAVAEPTPGGSIEELRDFANCANEGSLMLLCGFLVMCLNPRGPYPVAYPTGEQGSAKSTVSRLICDLVDPRIAPLHMGNPSIRDLAVIANSVWVVGFDNVSKVTPALSDALCQLATGGGYRTRELYTNAEPFVIDLKQPVLLNGIGQVIERPDLLDRVALIELAPIPPEHRRTEEEFWSAWEGARPRILGALLDGVAAALAGAEDVELEDFPRMADFARWGEAAGSAFGWEPGAFTAALEGSRQDLLEGSADAHPEIGALLTFMEERDEWSGSASELLNVLTDATDDAVTGSKVWPKRPDTLSNRLIQHAPLLRTHGLEIVRGREGGGKRKRFLLITKTGDAGTRGDA